MGKLGSTAKAKPPKPADTYADSDSPTGFTDDDDGHHSTERTKQGTVVSKHEVIGRKLAKIYDKLRISNMEHRLEKGNTLKAFACYSYFPVRSSEAITHVVCY